MKGQKHSQSANQRKQTAESTKVFVDSGDQKFVKRQKNGLEWKKCICLFSEAHKIKTA